MQELVKSREAGVKQPNISENHMQKFPAILKGLNDSILLIEKKAISVAEKLNTT